MLAEIATNLTPFIIAVVSFTSPFWMLWLFIKIENFVQKRKDRNAQTNTGTSDSTSSNKG